MREGRGKCVLCVLKAKDDENRSESNDGSDKSREVSLLYISEEEKEEAANGTPLKDLDQTQYSSAGFSSEVGLRSTKKTML